ncbi:MAG: MFS transporter, partial [Thermodesulfobacteriota bacterium]
MKIRDSVIFNKDFILITSLAFFYFFIFHSFLLLPLHLVNLGATEKVVGFIMGISGLSTLILTPSVGYLADRYGKKIFISSGLLVLSLSTLPFAFLDEINYMMFFLRIIQGASFSLFFISAGALIADLSPQNKKTEAIGVYGVFTVINYAIAPFIGSIIIGKYDFKTYMIYLSMFGITGFLLSLLVKNPSESNMEKSTSSSLSYLYYLKNKPSFISILTLFVLGAAFISTLNFISLFSISIEVESFYLYFVSYTATVLFIRILLGWVPDKFGKWKVSSLAVLAFGGGILLLAFTGSLTFLILASILFGVGHGFA